jgi:hypothetical protein
MGRFNVRSSLSRPLSKEKIPRRCTNLVQAGRDSIVEAMISYTALGILGLVGEPTAVLYLRKKGPEAR